MAKILVVDDEPDFEMLIKQRFRKQIRENKYEFFFAENGRYALEKIKEVEDLDLILSDINMPEMDGLTLLLKLQEQNSILKAIVVSAYGDMDNIRTAMNRGAFDFITKPINFEDLEITIEKTIKQVIQLKKTLKAIKENDILKMYVDDTLLHFMAGKEMEGSIFQNETIEATVAFIDISGFTKISETQSPEKVVGLLNHYFDIMVKEVIQENGIVDKFIGDAIMAVFKGEHHLERAIDACIAIRNEIEKLPAERDNTLFNPQVSTGINTGEMVAGNIGAVTLKRLDFTVIGDTVNTAARLQAAAKPGQILITEKSYALIADSFECNKIGEINMKNKKEPCVIYEVVN